MRHRGRIRRGTVGTACAGTRRRPLSHAHRHPLRTAALWIVALAATFAATSAAAQFTSEPVTAATVNEPYQYDIRAEGQGRVTIVASQALPEWLELDDAGNGRATLHGTPTQAGTYRVALRAEVSSCSFWVFFCPTQVFDIIVAEKPNGSPVVVAAGIADRSVTQGESVSVDVRPAFSDPDGDALSYGAAGLPAGFAISAGTITGVAPAAAALQTYTITVTANDGRGGTVSDAFVLRISPPSRADIYVNGIAAAPTPAAASEPFEIVAQFGNAGPSASAAGTLTLTLDGTAFTLTENPCSVTTAGNRQTLSCAVAAIAAGGTGSITLTGTAAVGDVYVTAALSADASGPPDSNAANNAAVATVHVGETIVAEAGQTVAIAATRALAGGDVDGDGFGDVIAATAAGEPALLLVNVDDPSGLHAALTSAERLNRGLASIGLGVGNAALSNDAVLADLDNDADLDLVVANGPGSPSEVFRNAGGGALQASDSVGAAGGDDRSAALGDVNGDGFADAVIARSDGIRLYTNVGGVSFTESLIDAAGDGALDALLANLTGSALPELVVVRSDGTVHVHDNSAGSFGAARMVDAGPATAVAAAELSGDGNGDLVVARALPRAGGVPAVPSNTVYFGSAAGQLTAAAELGAAPTVDVLTGDVDADGDTDVVAVNATGVHQVFVNAGGGSFTQHGRLLVSANAKAAALVRVGAAQKLDLVIGGDDGVRVFFNDGVGNFGLGDLEGPVITLNGTPEVAIPAGSAYNDPGATAMDAVDGPVTPAVDNTVDPNVIGSYVVTYTAADGAGNAAQPVTRTVRVEARDAAGGGGGGAIGAELLALAAAAAAALALRPRGSPTRRRSRRRAWEECQ